MAARPAMLHLIDRLRVWVSDPAGDGEAFTDDSLQAFLDDNREDVTTELVEAGAHRWTAQVGWWEDTAVLTDQDGTTIDPDDADLVVGAWTIEPDPVAVTVTGTVFDGHGAAADALETVLASVKAGQVTRWSDGDVTIHRTDSMAALNSLILSHRARSRRPVVRGRARSIKARRTDQMAAR